MAGLLSKGITLSYNGAVLTNLQEIPDLGGEAEAVEVTTLADPAHMYIDGILNYGDSLAFKFLYEKEQFDTLVQAGANEDAWIVTLPDKTTCSFTGSHSVKMDGIGINGAITYTLSVKPNSEMVWGTAAA